MCSDNTKQPPKKPSQEPPDQHVRLIHTLAVRLPWIVVAFSLLAVIIFIIEAYFRKGG